ncbi:MAG: hypothetical protein U9Q82_16010 [Chloroflexota bacterium]|nr:hypothetical protein [Chloroflexota bacterium]
MPIALDVHTGVLTAVILAGFFALISLLGGIGAIKRGRQNPYFRIRRELMVRGWKLLFLFLLLGLLAFLLNTYAEPVAYSFFPPSATPTLSPTISPTPTITQTPTNSLTPTITPTPEISATPTITLTPHIPMAIEAQFEGQLTPPADVIFSKLQFTNQGVDSLYRPIQPNDVFTNPVGEMYAYFTYDGMVDGTQWTALWYRDGELVNFETNSWEGGTGGAGFSDWIPDAENWVPGEYQVQIFVGLDWLIVGFFTIEGSPPTSTSLPSQTPSRTPTGTDTFTPTPWPTATPSLTPSQTSTHTPTKTFTATPTPQPTATASDTPPPTATPLPPTAVPTSTPRPTTTPSATSTPKPTYPPRASKTPTLTRQPRATPITPTATLTRRPRATPITPTPTLTRWPTPTRNPQK